MYANYNMREKSLFNTLHIVERLYRNDYNRNKNQIY